jgi:L-rhamnose mutarotase
VYRHRPRDAPIAPHLTLRGDAQGVIKAKPGMLDQYTQLHDHTWDQVMAKMFEANMRNFVVYYHEETQLMFHHWEYVGDDFDADMAKCVNDPIINFWWTHCEPCQEPFHWSGPPPSQGGHGDPAYPDQWWAPMKMLNHCGGWATAWSQSWPNPDHVPQNPQVRACVPRARTATLRAVSAALSTGTDLDASEPAGREQSPSGVDHAGEQPIFGEGLSSRPTS